MAQRFRVFAPGPVGRKSGPQKARYAGVYVQTRVPVARILACLLVAAVAGLHLVGLVPAPLGELAYQHAMSEIVAIAGALGFVEMLRSLALAHKIRDPNTLGDSTETTEALRRKIEG